MEIITKGKLFGTKHADRFNESIPARFPEPRRIVVADKIGPIIIKWWHLRDNGTNIVYFGTDKSLNDFMHGRGRTYDPVNETGG